MIIVQLVKQQSRTHMERMILQKDLKFYWIEIWK